MNSAASDPIVATLESKLKAFKGRFTLQDAASVTGLAVDDAKTGLDAMMSKYVCRLQMTENGDLIYDFGTALQRRGSRTVAEILAVVGQWAWKAFTVFFKAWIAVTLVVYFLIFLAILIGLMVAAASGKGNKRSSNINLGSVFDAFFSIFRWRTVTNTIGYRIDRQGYRYKHYEPKASPIFQNKKSFIGSVYDFVFGPPRVERDPLANEKEVAAFLRREKGIVTVSELTALAGWTTEQAEKFLSDCIVRFQGDAMISEDGTVYGRFDQLTRSVAEGQDDRIEMYWDEFEPEYEITGNSAGRNAAIVFLNLFNLIFSAVILNAYFHGDLKAFTANDFTIGFWLGWVPLVFSFIFFTIPVVRLVRIFGQRRRRTAMNKRKRLMRIVFERPEKTVPLDVAVREVNKTQEAKLSESDVRSTLESMMRDYQGETTLDSNGKTAYAFTRWQQELENAVKLRSGRTKEKNLGQVIMDSQN